MCLLSGDPVSSFCSVAIALGDLEWSLIREGGKFDWTSLKFHSILKCWESICLSFPEVFVLGDERPFAAVSEIPLQCPELNNLEQLSTQGQPSPMPGPGSRGVK